MVQIPGGEFLMGDHVNEGDPDELPVHPVWVDSFYIDIYGVTNQQYCAYLNSANLQGQIEVREGVIYATGGDDPYFSTSQGVQNSSTDMRS
jgi:formylglycine-generating enzyme required for sulfatase activity